MSTASRQLLRREERVESILAAAARAFARAGFAATSMDDIAAEAGITKLILYRHFEGKQELYEDVLTRVSDKLALAFRDATAGRRAAVGLRALLSVAREDPDAFLLLFRHAAREPRFAPYADGYLARVRDAAETWLAPQVEDPVLRRWLARVTTGTAIEAVIAWLAVGDPERDFELLDRADWGLRSMVTAIRDREREPC